MSRKSDIQIPLEPERYELTTPTAYHFELDRREFFRFLGAGILIVGVLKNAQAFQESGAGRGPDESLPKEIGAWLHIGENSAVTVYTGKVEVGQNIRTSLSQCVAEELQVPVQQNPNGHGRHAAHSLRHGDLRQSYHPHDESATEKSCRRRSRCADWFSSNPMEDRSPTPGRR